MIELGVKVFNKCVKVYPMTSANRAEYAARPRWIADGLRVYMARERICSHKGRTTAINALLLSECQSRNIPASTLVDTWRVTSRRDRRPKWEKEAHDRMEKLL